MSNQWIVVYLSILDFFVCFKTFDWSEEMQGLIFASYYWGYIVTQIPAGILAEKFGGKYVLSIGLLTAAIITVLTPFCLENFGKTKRKNKKKTKQRSFLLAYLCRV